MTGTEPQNPSECVKNVWLWHLRTRFSGERGGGVGLMVGLGGLEVFSNFNDSDMGGRVPILCIIMRTPDCQTSHTSWRSWENGPLVIV